MKQLLATLAVLALLAFALAGCSAGPQGKQAPTVATESRPPAALSDRASTEQGAAAPAPVSPQPSAPNAQAYAPAPAQASWDRMIIRNASVVLTVRDVENSLTAIRDIAVAAGGWVAQSNTRYEGERQVANISIQVPASAFESSIREIRRLAIKVESEVSNTQDVTEEYTDLESQVRNLKATEASLLNLMAKAERMEDILALQRELTNIRGQIERLQGRVNYLQRRVEMSTITVSLLPEGAPKPGDRPAWNPLATAEKAWNASAIFLQAVADVALSAIVFLWWAIPLAVVAWLLLRSRLRRRPTTSA